MGGFCSILYVLPSEATLTPDACMPSPPPRGRDLIPCNRLTCNRCPFVLPLLSLAYASANDLHGKLHGTGAPLVTSAQTGIGVGTDKLPPGPERTPFRGPHDYALHDPAAPLNLYS